MDDNSRPHRANIVDECLQSEVIPRMDWPVYSPNLNPIEHVWDMHGRRIAARQPSATCLPELRRALFDEWCNIPQDQIDNLILSMPRRWNPKKYLTFWCIFSKNYDSEELTAIDKFQFLYQSMESDSKAVRLLSSFPIIAENYPKAVEQLKLRFGREDLLVQIYVRDLLSLVLKNATTGKNAPDLATLYDMLETKLRVLESLGHTKEKFADFLEPLVESCLPENVL
ncbi:DUF1758 domain-containing protein [Trichonephila clavipes]|nr:DUF1758 domain-containing protein [Trichonephila clavipes]